MKQQSYQVSQVPPLSDAPGSLRDRAISTIAFATVLALLYVGRDVLIPLTLALMLSLLIAPMVRGLRRIGWGQTPSVLVAVLALFLVITAAAGVLGTQVLHWPRACHTTNEPFSKSCATWMR